MWIEYNLDIQGAKYELTINCDYIVSIGHQINDQGCSTIEIYTPKVCLSIPLWGDSELAKEIYNGFKIAVAGYSFQADYGYIRQVR